jgi:Cys-tRNA(Pro)/Cys-tRNA(Cys) deacylase
MTPAIDYLLKNKIKHRVLDYQHDATAQSYGLEAVTKLNLPEQQVFKTLIVSTEKQQLVVAIIPVPCKLNLKSVAKSLGCKKITMAAPTIVERSTGYVLGGVSPLGQRKRLTTIIDSSALEHDTIYVSAGKRGVEIGLCPNVLITQLNAKTSSLTQRG